MPAASRWAGVAWVRSWPARLTWPEAVGRSPISASHSSVCPLPCTPATPRISPARTWNDSPFTQTRPVWSATVMSDTSSTTSPGLAGSLLTRSCTFRPTISVASSSSVADGGRWPTTAPRRSTVIVSAMVWTSLSLCEMKTTDVPPSLSCLMIRNKSSVSAGVSTAVGSSRISTVAFLTSALTISTRCWMPTGRSSTRASGSSSSPYRRESSLTSRRVLRRSSTPLSLVNEARKPANAGKERPRRVSRRPESPVSSMPRVTFSATVNTGTSMKCWCTIPMPAAMASFGERNLAGLPSSRISPSSGCNSPYSTFIRVDLPAPFSPSRAWTCPGATDRSMRSLATSEPKRLVMPFSSSSTSALHIRCRKPMWQRCMTLAHRCHIGRALLLDPLHRALGRRLDRAALDARRHLVELGLQRGRDLAGEVVVRGEHGPAVGQRADVGAAGERAVGRREHRGLHRRHDALLHAGDEVRAVRRRADAAVGVHPEHVDLVAASGLVGLLDGLGRAEPDVTRDREDDVRTLADERLGQRLALGLVGEVAGERALLGRLVPAEHLDVRAELGVVVLNAVPEAVHVDGHGPEVLPAERGHLAGLGHARGQVSAEEAVLHSVEHQLVDVALLRCGQALRRVGAVHDRELLARVGLGRGLGRGAHQEADGHDDAAVRVEEGVDVQGVVVLRRRLQELDADVRIGRRGRLHARPRRGVERPVVDAAGVGDHAAEELGRGCRRSRAGRRTCGGGAGRGRAAAAAAPGDGQRCRHGQRHRGPCAVFHAYLHWARH